jgi:isopropylmalate/homocitrate/citramalate synthase
VKHLSTPDSVRIIEVGPRDGLQNEPERIPTVDKITFVNMLGRAGFDTVEVTSFVRPSRIPQLADAAQVFPAVEKRPGVRYTALVPNEKGMENAVQAGVRSIAVFTGASETFTRRNINMSIDESLERFREVARIAASEDISVRGYISVVFGCPYEGRVSPDSVLRIAEAMLEMGCYELSLGDTIGVGVPPQIEEVIDRLSPTVPIDRMALHLHDTRGTALANVLTGLAAGVRAFDSSAGGLGGCPYAPGAAGNLATEDLVYMLEGMGVHTGVDLAQVVEATSFVTSVLGRPVPGKYARAALAARGQ